MVKNFPVEGHPFKHRRVLSKNAIDEILVSFSQSEWLIEHDL
jgi:hypothetical protein